VAFYAALFAISPWALLLYIAAVAIRINCVRFVDAFQHTYDHVPAEIPKREPDRVFEQRNTFSFPVARRYTFLNLLILNFGFHNAHHAVMTCPWYNLRKLDDVLDMARSGGALPSGHEYDRHSISFTVLLRRYHADRTSRITAGDSGTAYDAEAEMAFSMRKFSGAFTDNLLG
jgi:fatty acid desaturase